MDRGSAQSIIFASPGEHAFDKEFDKLVDGLDFRAGCKTAVFHILAEQGFKIQGQFAKLCFYYVIYLGPISTR